MNRRRQTQYHYGLHPDATERHKTLPKSDLEPDDFVPKLEPVDDRDPPGIVLHKSEGLALPLTPAKENATL